METILWSHNVTYNPNTNTITFVRSGQNGNEAESLIDYYREEYPRLSWIELVQLALPEVAGIHNKETLAYVAQ